MLKFHDPRGASAIEDTPYTQSLDVDAMEGGNLTIGLLANGFPDSVNFLQAIADALVARLPNLNVRLWDKGNASIPAPESMLQEMRQSCQAVVAAYGH
ncbi:MAG TPA: hypothetical protein DER02_06095 [Gammaproteobacteria bacterium]|nr:hypothetical protein [Gammaproteobacteria bacterium]|tara:strand:- start:2078 stop:2371 length:294 start_codon:yes stop_codon:yes gene_type:complete